MNTRLTLIFSTFAVVACASCGGHRHGGEIGEHHYPAKDKDAPIEVFLTKRPERAYEEIGLFRREASEDAADNIRWAQREARKIGGDAVIVNQNAGTHTESNAFWGTTTGGNMEDVIVIHWTAQ